MESDGPGGKYWLYHILALIFFLKVITTTFYYVNLGQDTVSTHLTLYNAWYPGYGLQLLPTIMSLILVFPSSLLKEKNPYLSVLSSHLTLKGLGSCNHVQIFRDSLLELLSMPRPTTLATPVPGH